MLFADVYMAALERGDIQEDSEQQRLLMPLQRIADALRTDQIWYKQLLPKQPIRGLYITGQVGIGKTYMMDLFYQYLPEKGKLRAHFLHFMQQIDQKLRFFQGQKDPIMAIAKELAQQYRIICIDEFMVDDMAYAMILGGLLRALFRLRVVIVATSNTKIDNLYRNGMNRERFLPAIDLLHQNCDEIDLQSDIDYRLGKPMHLYAYVYPLNADAEQLLVKQFWSLAVTASTDKTLIVQERTIEAVLKGETVIWFDFDTICAMPRCQLDYIELAERFHTIFVSNVPQLNTINTNTAIVLFIQLVDILYDRGIRLIISAAVPAHELYQSGPFVNEFARTLSRLEEMQSEDYLNRHCVVNL
ncbi:MAG: cell division protein ZapE [Gammaproteobacteria bacterium]